MEKVKNILIDTDIGDDVDDALAIAFAMCSPEVRIQAVTTVFKNTGKRAELVQALLKVYGNSGIPVYEGVGKPIINTVQENEIPCQYQVIGEADYKKSECHASDIIIRTLERDPDTILVAIGPLTNIALAVMKAPEIMSQANIYMMGGAFGKTEPEWNILCDPEAASVVFQSGADIRVFGLDVTVQCALSEEQLSAAFSTKNEKARFLAKLMKAWMHSSGYGVTLHDALTLAAVIDPELIEYEEKEVFVELRGENTRGATIIRQSFFGLEEHPNVKIAAKVKKEAFLNLFMQRVFL